MMRRTCLGLISLLLAGCGVGEGTGSTPPWAQAPTPVADAAKVEVADAGGAADDVEQIPPYRVKLETTKGDVVIAVHPEWAPRGALRFKELVNSGYFSDMRLFRVVPGFVVQFGMHGDPNIYGEWESKRIKDDRVKVSNKKGYVTFATSGPNSRTTQVFVNLKDNPNLDTAAGSFAPFGEVVEGMEIVEAFNSKYGEAPSKMQGQIASGGNAFLDQKFPGLDTIISAAIIGEATGENAAGEDATDEAAAETPPAADPATTDAPAGEAPKADSPDDESQPVTEEPTTDAAPKAAEASTPDEAPAAEPAAEETPAEGEASSDGAEPAPASAPGE